MTDLPVAVPAHLPHPKPWQRNLVFGTIATTIVMGWIGDALWASLVDTHPLALIALNAKPRYLLLTVNEIQTGVFYAFATVRLVCTKPLVWLVGAWYGPRTMVWAEGRSARGGKVIRWMERHFARFGWAIVLVTSNNVVSLLAGSAGMHLGLYVLLATIGTLVRLWLLDLIGEALTKPIDAVIGFVGDGHAQRYAALLGELHRIGEQIADDLTDARAIADEQAASVGGGLHLEIQPLLVGAIAHRLDARMQRRFQIEGPALQPQLAGLDLGDVQEVADQAFQGHAALAHQGDHLGLFDTQAGARQCVDDADHPVQRRADLVADIGQEVGLGAAGGLGGRLGLDQLALGGDAVGDVARHAVDVVAKPLRAPFQGAIAAGLMPVAVDIVGRLTPRRAGLDLDDAALRVGQVVGMHQVQQDRPLQLVGIVAEHVAPRLAGLDHAPGQIADHQQVERKGEEGGDIDRRHPGRVGDRRIDAEHAGHGVAS